VAILIPFLAQRLLGNNAPVIASVQAQNIVIATCSLTITGILIWADRKPMERKGVLLPLLIICVPGLLLSRFYNVMWGGAALSAVLPFSLVLTAVFVLFLVSYLYASRPSNAE